LLSGSSVVSTCTSWSSGYFSFNNINYGQYTINFIKSGYAQTQETVSVQSSEISLGTFVLPSAIQLSTSTSTLITTPDAQFNIPFTIENLGSSTITVDLTTSRPEGWYTRIWSGDYEVPKVTLSSGQSLTLQLDIVVPPTAPIDQEHNVSINALGITNSSLKVLVLTRSQPSEIPTLSLQSSILSLVANSGEKLLLPFTVTNIGDATESIVFSVSAPEGWSTRILNSNGWEITKASLASGSSASFELEVIIPQDYVGDPNLTLTVAGTTVAVLDFALNVEPLTESVLSCSFPGKLAVPGDTVEFKVMLSNPFNVETRFKVSPESVPVNWTVYVTNPSHEAVTEIMLGAGESVELTVDVTSIASASTDEIFEIVITAESGEQNVGSIALTVSIQEPGSLTEIGLTTKFPEVTVEAGKAFSYQINLANYGSVSRIVLLSVDAPADWKAVIKSGTSEISQLNIAPASSDGVEQLTIEFTPPSTVNLDTYNISVQIKSESGVLLAELDLKATITGSYGLQLSLSTLLTSTTSGESASCTATLINTGYSTLSVVDLEFEAEDGWDVTISPSQVDLLKPQQSYTFDVVMETPTDTVSGDYLVTLTGISDQTESNPMQIRVTVNTSTSWGIYGFGIAIVVVLALILVFKKFKRR
jgi:uncharacterized membrane protein